MQNQQTEKLDNKLVDFNDFIISGGLPKTVCALENLRIDWLSFDLLVKPKLSNFDVRKITPAATIEDARYRTILGQAPT